MVGFAESEVAVSNCKVVNANVHAIENDRPAKSVLLDPCLCTVKRGNTPPGNMGVVSDGELRAPAFATGVCVDQACW
jgi:hypothetical protein